jgi:nonsense-mediated mRNA decay protein 3
VHCLSSREGSKWINSDLSEDEIISNNIFDHLELHQFAENAEISLELVNQKGSTLEILATAQGRMLGEKVDGECLVTVKVNRMVCPECSKHASGYYEAVIQLRVDKRSLEIEEIKEADKIIQENLDKLAEKNRMAYLADRAELKEGIDYYIGSYKVARNISNKLKDLLGGVLQESPRLMGKDKSSGKDLYRIWISLRLPHFKKGDFIGRDNFKVMVINMDGRGILVNDLDTGQMFSIPWKEYDNWEKIAQGDEVKLTTITNITPNLIQVLHPDTYEPQDLDFKDGMEKLDIGNEIAVVEIHKKLYILIENDIPGDH